MSDLFRYVCLMVGLATCEEGAGEQFIIRSRMRQLWDSLSESDRKEVGMFSCALKAVIITEREACAKVAEDENHVFLTCWDDWVQGDIAKAIRARGEKPNHE